MNNVDLKKIILIILNSCPELKKDTCTRDKIATELYELILQRNQQIALNRGLEKRRADLKLAAQILKKGPADKWSSVLSVVQY